MTNVAAEWETGIRELHAETGGLLKIYTVSPRDGLYLVAGAAMGDQFCRGLVDALAESARRIQHAPKHEPMLCLTCPIPIATVTGATMVLALPGNEQPSRAFGSALCQNCARHPDVDGMVVEAMRTVWPNLRPITVSHAAGHA